MIHDSFTVNSRRFSAASYEMLPLNVHYAEEPLWEEFTNSSWAKDQTIFDTWPHKHHFRHDHFLGTLWCPAGYTPALRRQDIDISGHKAAHQISSSPEQPYMSEQLENTPEAPNVWFTTLQINNLQPGSTATSPHRPPLNGPFTNEELLRSSNNYFLEVQHFMCTYSCRNMVHFLLPVLWECMWF